MKKALTLSVVIPAYNEEEQLYYCLDALAHQTEPPDQVIVVDNNSKDGTAAVARKFPFVQVIKESRQGLRFARDTGMAKATGDIVGRIDADSRVAATWAAEARRMFDSDATIMAAAGPCYFHDMPARKIGLAMDRNLRRQLFKFDTTPLLYGSNMILRREAWRTIKHDLCTKGEFFEDYDITIHLRQHGLKIVYDEKLVVGVSSRRVEDDPLTFFSGMQLHTKTFAMHDMKSPAAQAAKYFYITSYPLAHLLRRTYDPRANRISLAKIFKRARPRPNANT